jgi:hypothetical protein
LEGYGLERAEAYAEPAPRASPAGN